MKKTSNLLVYANILRTNEDWDYMFLIDLIEFKLKRMRDYFWTHDIIVNEKRNGDICQKLLNLLNAGYKTEIIKSDDLKGIYVNTKNAKRFFNSWEYNNYLLQNNFWKAYGLAELRANKAKYLFWKMLYYKIELLWD